MKVIIAGSRTINDYSTLLRALENFPYDITEVVCGGAVGVDSLGERWARVKNIPVTHMPAEWNRYGNSAGPIRNRKMAEYADCALVIWDGKSKGAHNLIENMKRLNKRQVVYVESKDLEGLDLDAGIGSV